MLKKNLDKGPSGGMVDALVSGASVERRASSILVLGTLTKRKTTYCGNSSVGRARPCQGRGREFESRFPLKMKPIKFGFFLQKTQMCLRKNDALVVELVDTQDLKSCDR